MQIKPIYKLLGYWINKTIGNKTRFSYSSKDEEKIKSNKEFDILTCEITEENIEKINKILKRFVWEGRGKDRFIETNRKLILEMKEQYETLFSIDKKEYDVGEINILDDIYTIYSWKQILESTNMEKHIGHNNLTKILNGITDLAGVGEGVGDELLKDKYIEGRLGSIYIDVLEKESDEVSMEELMEFDDDIGEMRDEKFKKSSDFKRKKLSNEGVAAPSMGVPPSAGSPMPKITITEDKKEGKKYNFLWNAIHYSGWLFFSVLAFSAMFYWITNMGEVNDDDIDFRKKIIEFETVEKLQDLKEQIKAEVSDSEYVQKALDSIEAKIDIIKDNQIKKERFTFACEEKKGIILDEDTCVSYDNINHSMGVYAYENIKDSFSVLHEFSLLTGMQNAQILVDQDMLYFDGDNLYYILQNDEFNIVYRNEEQVGHVDDIYILKSELESSENTIKSWVDQELQDKLLLSECDKLGGHIKNNICIYFDNEELTIAMYILDSDTEQLKEDNIYKIVSLHKLLTDNKQHLVLYENDDYINYDGENIYYTLEFNNKYFLFKNGDNIVNFEQLVNLEKDLKKKDSISNLVSNHGYTFDMLMSGLMYKILGDMNGGNYEDKVFFADESLGWLIWYIILSGFVLILGFMLKNMVKRLFTTIYYKIKGFLQYMYYEIYTWPMLAKILLILTMNLSLLAVHKVNTYLTIVLGACYIIIILFYYISLYEHFLKVIYSYFNFYYLNVVIVEEYKNKLKKIDEEQEKSEKKEIKDILEQIEKQR